MQTISTLLLLGMFMGFSCSGPKNATAINQGIRGVVAEAVGNQMPSPDREPTGPQPVATTVYVYELTNLSQVQRDGAEPSYTAIRTKEVAKVQSEKNGQFVIGLPPGRYSLFTKVDGKFYANSFDEKNNIQAVTVEANQISEVRIVISAKAFY
jgi:hypothetical protein